MYQIHIYAWQALTLDKQPAPINMKIKSPITFHSLLTCIVPRIKSCERQWKNRKDRCLMNLLQRGSVLTRGGDAHNGPDDGVQHEIADAQHDIADAQHDIADAPPAPGSLFCACHIYEVV